MLQLYGNSLSRAIRCMWMLEEMGLPYELIKKTTRPKTCRARSICASTRMRAFPRW